MPKIWSLTVYTSVKKCGYINLYIYYLKKYINEKKKGLFIFFYL